MVALHQLSPLQIYQMTRYLLVGYNLFISESVQGPSSKMFQLNLLCLFLIWSIELHNQNQQVLHLHLYLPIYCHFWYLYAKYLFNVKSKHLPKFIVEYTYKYSHRYSLSFLPDSQLLHLHSLALRKPKVFHNNHMHQYI
jgi:hypothetical protein